MRRGDLTEGIIWRRIVALALPLLLGQILQQLYNTVGAVVVGNFVSSEALAAVGSVGPLSDMLISFFMGISSGASVLIAQSFGARDRGRVQDAVHTAMLLAVGLGAVLSVVGMVISPSVLRWMRTPADVLPDAVRYLRTLFAGLLCMSVYNMGSAILTATGESRKPLYCLMAASAVNIGCSLLFVPVFGMGVEGVALATVLAQLVSAVLVVIMLCRADADYKLRLRGLRLNAAIVRRIAMIGLPGGIQQAIINLSNIVVQSYINGLGGIAMAGYGACTRVEPFVFLPAQVLSLVAASFVGQNLGARQVQRARQGVRVTLRIALVATALLAALALLFGHPLLRIFTPDAQVLALGYEFLWAFIPFYILLCFTQILPSALRGAGDVRFATLTCIGCFVGLRQIYLAIITRVMYTPTTVALGYPVTWAVAAVMIVVYYRRSNWDGFAEVSP